MSKDQRLSNFGIVDINLLISFMSIDFQKSIIACLEEDLNLLSLFTFGELLNSPFLPVGAAQSC